MKTLEEEAAEASQRLETALRLANEAITILERLKQAPLIYDHVSELVDNEEALKREQEKSDEEFEKNMAVTTEMSAAFQKLLDAAGLIEEISFGDTPGKKGATLRGFQLRRDYSIDSLKV